MASFRFFVGCVLDVVHAYFGGDDWCVWLGGVVLVIWQVFLDTAASGEGFYDIGFRLGVQVSVKRTLSRIGCSNQGNCEKVLVGEAPRASDRGGLKWMEK